MTARRVPLLLRMRCWLAAQAVMRLAALVGIAAFLADWASKSWAVATLTDATATLGSLMIAPARNEAFAFSAGASIVPSSFVMGARLFALLAIGVLFGRLVVRDRRSAAGLGLILGGGFGNAADLAFRGAVVDFLGLGPFTFNWAGELMDIHIAFNAADLAILVGIALLAPRIRTCALELQRRISEWEARWGREPRQFL